MKYVIDIQDLSYSWPDSKTPVLKIPQWQVEQGQGIFLYGASGSGKSTLLNCLAGILRPQQGNIRILDSELTTMGARARDRFRAQHMGFIFQQFNLLPYLTVETNIQLAAHFGRPSNKQFDYDIKELLARLSLDSHILSKQAGCLSIGQQQRVAVARALINQPQIIIADEPTSALDTDSRDNFIELLLNCARTNNSCVIFVSHDRSLATHFDLSLNIDDINKPEAVTHVA
ncbi:MAG: ABC transporter ATP-binding protein [Gammaproteobacteria bacterium]|nr:ABC transporter ATP-binding protein [Gammaproteobacteria bacterium]